VEGLTIWPEAVMRVGAAGTGGEKRGRHSEGTVEGGLDRLEAGEGRGGRRDVESFD